MNRNFSSKQQRLANILRSKPEWIQEYDAMHCDNLITLFKKLHLLAIKIGLLLKNRTEETRGDILKMGMEREKEIYKSFRKREREFIKKHTGTQNGQQ